MAQIEGVISGHVMGLYAAGHSLGVAAVTSPSGDTITKSAHGLTDGTRVILTDIVASGGINDYTVYFVVNKTTDAFKVSLTSGGAAVDITVANGTCQYHVLTNVLVAAMKNVSLDLGVAMRDMNNAGTGDFDTVKPGRRNWSASGSGHFQFDAAFGYEDLYDAWKAGKQLTCVFSSATTGNLDFTGIGYIESLKAKFPDLENSTYDFNIKGSTDNIKTTH